MATALDAVRMEEGRPRLALYAVRMEEGRPRLALYLAAARKNTLWRITLILALVGVLLICLTLFKIPNIDGGYPLFLNHEILFTFAAGIVVAILLNLFILLMHLLSCINRRKLNNTTAAAAAAELIEQCQCQCLRNEKKIKRAIKQADGWVYVLGLLFWIYVFLVAVAGSFLPYGDRTFTGYISGRYGQIASGLCVLLKRMVDRIPDDDLKSLEVVLA